MTSPSPRLAKASKPELFIRILFPDGTYLGPGKVELLELIAQHGSISAAGKAMGMSYKRAWHLAEDINGMFCSPLIEKQHGGLTGGGAALTKAGADVIAHYRAIQAKAARAAATHTSALDGAHRTVRKAKSS